jgi:serine phosphatase RsbU (regulator of sigma subunit)
VAATATYTVLTITAYVVAHLPPFGPGPVEPVGLVLVVVGGLGALAVCSSKVRARHRARRVRAAADTTRQTVLRPLPPVWAGLEQAAVHTAADETARIGGDFYDIQPSPHGTRPVLGDVQGKGLDAVACAAALVGSFREDAAHERDLVDVAVRMDQRPRRHQEYVHALGGNENERFATAVLAQFPPVTATDRHATTVELVDCGHLTPLAVTPDRIRPLAGESALPLGMFELTGARPVGRSLSPAADETLLLYSDGVAEARDDNGEFHPLREDLAAALREDPGLAEPRRLVAHVRSAAARHAGGRLADDTTVLAVRRASTR